jgi:hypothetical protein
MGFVIWARGCGTNIVSIQVGRGWHWPDNTVMLQIYVEVFTVHDHKHSSRKCQEEQVNVTRPRSPHVLLRSGVLLKVKGKLVLWVILHSYCGVRTQKALHGDQVTIKDDR